MEGPAASRILNIATPSGKNRATENFPVGSLLIKKELRAHVHAYYRFARMGDDIADNPALLSQDKIDRLDQMEKVLKSDGDESVPVASEMRRSLQLTGVPIEHCTDLLIAFRMDATKQRYESWAELMDYCRYSASPVGRYLLDLHGETKASWDASDALCNALQVINHLQDCQEDAKEMNRIYIPLDHLYAEGVKTSDLLLGSSHPALRRVLDRLLDQTQLLVANADHLPAFIQDPRMRAEAAIIINLAKRLITMLRRGDPLVKKIKLNKMQIALAAISGFGRAIMQKGRNG